MKDILFKRRCDPKEQVKVFSILQRTEDAECITKIRKSFRYEVYRADKDNVKELESPQAYIKKFLNTRKSVEKFTFKVKGAFYLNYKEHFLRVDFQHTLNIHLSWKSKNFMPQKNSVIAG